MKRRFSVATGVVLLDELLYAALFPLLPFSSAGAIAGTLAAGAIVDAAGDRVAFLAAALAGAFITPLIAVSRRPLREECVAG